ncbi:G5 domain-containing protein [Microbacteriaceae bacterium VKM Ac-2855]|nr:G5 domain-containing protein [Microbacteriaceae bacterium VKM Ac-2855]
MTKEIVTETEPIGHGSVSVNDDAMDQGTSAVVVSGQDGVLTRTIEVTKQDGIETTRATTSELVTSVPVDEVIHVGTRVPAPAPAPQPADSCDPNYTGACVPISSDVDCAGGSGNGPAYVSGPVTIVGSDIYDLDRDGDGIACD